MKKALIPISYLWGISIIAAWGGVLFGYDAVVMSGTVPIVLKQFDFSSFQLGFLVSSVLWGCVIGSFISGILVDRVGRKPLLILAAVIILISAIFTSISKTIPQLITYRLIGGIGGGMVTTICPLYISEIAPADKRGRLVSLYHFSVCLGIVICVFVNWAIYSFTQNNNTHFNDVLQWFMIDQYWRLMFFSEVLPALVFLAGVCIIPETPRWLFYRNQASEARGIMLRINPLEQITRIEKEIRMSIEAGLASTYKDVFSRIYRKPLLIAIALCALSEACGISAVLYYGPQLLEQSGISLGRSLGGFSIIAIVNLIFNIIAITYMDSMGRRKLLGIGTIGCMISLIIIGIFFSLQNIGILLVLPFISFIAFFGFSVGPVKFIIISEIFPIQIRGKAVSLATVVIWITSAGIAQLFPMLRDIMATSSVFFLFAIDLALLLLLNVVFLEETKGKSIEAVYQTWFRPKGGEASV